MVDQIQVLQTRITDANDNPAAGAIVTFYRSGTTVKADIFSDSAAAVPMANPVIADGDGRIPQVFFAGGYEVKVFVQTALGATLDTIDPAPRWTSSTSAASGISFSPTGTNGALNVQQAIENATDAASETPLITNLDTLAASGPFRFASTATGAPSGTYSGVGYSVYSALRATQTVDTGSGLILTRTKTTGSWSAWVSDRSLPALGLTATATELNYSDGVTSNIQTQLDTKAPIASPTFTGTASVDGTSAAVDITDTDSVIAGVVQAQMRLYGSDGLAASIGHIGSTDLYMRSQNKSIILDADFTGVTASTNITLRTDNASKLRVDSSNVTAYVPVAIEGTAASVDITDTDTAIAGVVSAQMRLYGSDGLAASIGHITSSDLYMRSETKSIILDADFTNATGSSNVTMRTDNVSRLRVDSSNVTAYVPFSGDGSGLTALNATQLTTGAVPSARLTSVPAGNLTGDIAAARLTNAKVATGNAGTAVGDIAYLHCDNIVGYYGTAAGSTLHPAGVTDLGVTIDTGTVLSGTWRCLGANGPSTGSTLWRRES